MADGCLELGRASSPAEGRTDRSVLASCPLSGALRMWDASLVYFIACYGVVLRARSSTSRIREVASPGTCPLHSEMQIATSSFRRIDTSTVSHRHSLGSWPPVSVQPAIRACTAKSTVSCICSCKGTPTLSQRSSRKSTASMAWCSASLGVYSHSQPAASSGGVEEPSRPLVWELGAAAAEDFLLVE